MKLRFWRRQLVAEAGWLWVNRSLAYEMAAEMATWPEPIDVIRSALGLPDRWQRAVARAWHELLALAASQIPLITATDAEAARMARLMIASPSLNQLEASWSWPKRYRQR